MTMTLKKKPEAAPDKLETLDKMASELPILTEEDYVTSTKITPSGSLALDLAIGTGGYPSGCIIDSYGGECLSGDSFVRYDVIGPDGAVINDKGGTIENLYYRFHGKQKPGRTGRLPSNGNSFTVSSINSGERVFKNKILNVIQSGVKPVFKITTSDGHVLKATGEHRFYIGSGKYKKLSELAVGDTVFSSNGTRHTGGKFKRKDKEVYVKTHPSWRSRVINGCSYKRARVCVAIVEAEMNGMKYGEFVDMLNRGGYNPKSIKTIKAGHHVHHINHDGSDNSRSNLAVMDGPSHNRYHAKHNDQLLRFVVDAVKVKSIIPAGKCMTYDITCPAPNNNFIANGMVVHNSAGKSLLSIMAMAQVQNAGGVAVVWDVERSYSKNTAWLKVNGVDTKKLRFIKLPPEQGCEHGMNAVEKIARAGAADLIVVDSIPAMVPQSSLDRSMTDNDMVSARANALTRHIQRLVSIIDTSKTTVLFINQVRANMGGGMYEAKERETTIFALKHAASLRLQVTKLIGKDNIKLADGVPVGHRVRVKVVKNKLAAPYKTAEFDLFYNSGVDVASEIADIFLGAGVAKQSGSWIDFEGQRVQGQKKFVELIREPKNLEKYLKQAKALSNKVNHFGGKAPEADTQSDNLSIEEDE
jgi:recombination protein RecA